MVKRGFKSIASALSLVMLLGVCNTGAVFAAGNSAKNTSVSTIYYNGTIITANDAQPTAEAVLVTDGKIVAVGDQDEILESKDADTTLVNLDGKTMLPGFIDPHSHLSMVSKYDDYTPGTGISSVDELVEVATKNFDKWYETSINEGTYEDGDWYVGNGYDNTTYPNAVHPTADDLDKVSTEVPICIIHASSHMGAVNHKALELLGFTKGSALVEKYHEEIEVDADGNPTGVISEDAYFMLYYMPNVLFDTTKTNSGSNEDNLMKAMNLYASYGITTGQDASSSQIKQTVKNIVDNGGELLIDINSYGSAEQMTSSTADSNYVNGYRDIGVKYVVDGSPQAKTAWLLDPYYVVPDGKDASYNGFPTKTDEEVYQTAVNGITNGYQIVAHTNGSAAIQQFIDQYEKALKDTGSKADLRPTLIHAQTITEEQLDKCAELGISISFFTDHVYYWGDYHLNSTLGAERANRISPMQSAMDRGINVTMHQDSPVVDPNMLFSIQTAVTRQTRDGVTLGSDYAVSVMDAIKSVTINSAYQTFEEDTKGSIEAGKNADLIILDKNPLEVKATTIKDINILMTIKDGKAIYTSDDYSEPVEEEKAEISLEDLNIELSTNNYGQAINQTYTVSVKEGKTLDLSKLEFVYSTDALLEGEQNVWCDYAGINYTTAPWYAGLTSDVVANVSEGKLNVKFNSNTVIEGNTGVVTMYTRMSKSDWSKYSKLTNESLQVYYNGTLVK